VPFNFNDVALMASEAGGHIVKLFASVCR
jgi:hypothetical protein